MSIYKGHLPHLLVIALILKVEISKKTNENVLQWTIIMLSQICWISITIKIHVWEIEKSRKDYE